MKMSEVTAAYVAVHSAWQKKHDAIRARRNRGLRMVERAAADDARHWKKCPRWLAALVRPIADAIAEKMPDRQVSVLGPFGLSHEAAIHATLKSAVGTPAWSDSTLSITVVPGDLDKGELLVRNYSANTGEFAAGTIGAMNSMNHPSAPIPEDADVDWFIARMT